MILLNIHYFHLLKCSLMGFISVHNLTTMQNVGSNKRLAQYNLQWFGYILGCQSFVPHNSKFLSYSDFISVRYHFSSPGLLINIQILLYFTWNSKVSISWKLMKWIQSCFSLWTHDAITFNGTEETLDNAIVIEIQVRRKR